MKKWILALVALTIVPSLAAAECPPCDVPTGYENGIHNMTQLTIVVEEWEEEIEEEQPAPYEYCCCCFTTNVYYELRPTDPIDDQDCDGYNPNCKIRGNSCVWITETEALDDLENRDEEGNLSGESDYRIPWTRIEVSCEGSPWLVCPGSTNYGSAVLIFIPDCFECP